MLFLGPGNLLSGLLFKLKLVRIKTLFLDIRFQTSDFRYEIGDLRLET